MDETHNIDKLATKFAEAFADEVPDKPDSVIWKIIRLRSDIAEKIEAGYTIEKIANLLAKIDIHITAGALRNYNRLIFQALRDLQAEGSATPTHQDVHARVCQMRRNERMPKLATKSWTKTKYEKSSHPATVSSHANPQQSKARRQEEL